MTDPIREICEHCSSLVTSYPKGCPGCGAPQCCQRCCREANAAAVIDSRPCTCHPDDNPPVPCEHRYALTECVIARLERDLAQAKAELSTLRAECERLREDAERYRWLRDQAGEDGRAMVSVLKPGCNWCDDDMGVSKEPLDSAIDAAMKEQP